MKTLILMRHAHAAKAEPGEDDEDRPLDARGQEEAAALGAWLRAEGHLPERALVSSAQRTRETFQGMGLEADVPKKVVDELYAAMPAQILSLLETLRADSAMVIGHNPGIEKLKFHLLRDQEIADEALDTPPGNITVLEFDVDAWEEAKTAPARLKAYTAPKLIFAA